MRLLWPPHHPSIPPHTIAALARGSPPSSGEEEDGAGAAGRRRAPASASSGSVGPPSPASSSSPRSVVYSDGTRGGALPAEPAKDAAGEGMRGEEEEKEEGEGEGEGEEEVDECTLLQHMFKWRGRAAEGGWMREWVEGCMAPDVRIVDYVPGPLVDGKDPFVLAGVKDVLEYYLCRGNYFLNVDPIRAAVLRGQARAVNSSLSGLRRVAPSVARALRTFAAPTAGGGERSGGFMFQYRLSGGRIGEMTVWPAPGERPCGAPHPAPHANPAPAAAAAAAAGSGRGPPPSGSAPVPDRPCAHNGWDNVRCKRGWIILRCRECHRQWRKRPSPTDRCSAFLSDDGCAAGAACARLHVHHTKQTLRERQLAPQPPPGVSQ